MINDEKDKNNGKESFGIIISRVSGLMKKKLIKSFQEIDENITPEEFSILVELWKKDNVFQSEIVEKSRKDKTRITRLLNSLMQKGLVEKHFSEKDRRNFMVCLTDKGKNLEESLKLKEEFVLALSLNDISEEDLKITLETLKKVFSNLEKKK